METRRSFKQAAVNSLSTHEKEVGGGKEERKEETGYGRKDKKWRG